MNSEDIKNRFGSYHVEVLQQNQVHRVASLYSEHGEAKVCRTLAVTYFWQPTPESVVPADQLIRQGQSIGSTLLAAGLLLERELLLEAATTSGTGFERLSAGTVKPGTALLIRLYRLNTGIDQSAMNPYATIAEAHHPEHLSPDPTLKDLVTLNSQERGDAATAALASLLANLQ